MRVTSFTILSAFLTVASAHFQLQYPPPRGPFEMQPELTFCDGYADAVPNRSEFPLSNGIISLNSEHAQWTLGVIISTEQDPNTFTDFEDGSGNFQIAKQYFSTTGEGSFCMPIDLSAANISGVTDGANVTIQIVFSGGDGQLYQCADLTLSSKIGGIPTNVNCTNATDSVATPASAGTIPTSTGSTSASSTSSGSGSGSLSPTGSGANVNAAFSLTSLLALAGVVVAFT